MENKASDVKRERNGAMDGQKLALSVGLVILAVTCFVIGAVAVAIPYWGNFRNRVYEEKGNFGPWKLCKDLHFGRQMCGSWTTSSFRPSFTVFAAGICGSVGVGALGLYCLLCALHISMLMGRAGSRPILSRRQVLISKLLFINMAALLTIAAVALFAFQGNDLERGYIVEVTFCFYMEVVVAIFTTIVMLLTVAEFISWRGEEGEAIVIESTLTPIGLSTTMIGNPAYRDPVNGTSPSVSVTESSRVHFVPSSKFINGRGPRGSHAPPSTKKKSFSSSSMGGHRSSINRGRKMPSSTSKMRQLFSPQDSNSSSINSSSNYWNGSVTSMTPSHTDSVNGGSSITDSASTLSTVVSTNPSVRGILRSSLKKPKTTPDGFGIKNPGFVGSSPTLSRTGSLKRVRIQTNSTDV